MGNFFNPPASELTVPQAQTYNPQGMGQTDTNLLGGIGNLGQYNMYGQNLGQAQGIAQGMVNDPNAASFQQGAGTASQMGMSAANNAYGAGGSLYGQANNLFGAGNALATTAFDPQQALYGRTQQQLQDQTRASQGARGISMSPYGAGLENQAMGNFNIDWQNNQLQRQLQGVQGMSSAYGQGAAMMGQGSSMQSGAASQYLSAAGMPYSVSQGIGQSQLGALNQLGQYGQSAAQIPQQQIADWQNYMGWGTSQMGANNQAEQNQFKNELAQEKQAYGENQNNWNNIGKLVGTGMSFFL